METHVVYVNILCNLLESVLCLCMLKLYGQVQIVAILIFKDMDYVRVLGHIVEMALRYLGMTIYVCKVNIHVQLFYTLQPQQCLEYNNILPVQPGK